MAATLIEHLEFPGPTAAAAQQAAADAHLAIDQLLRDWVAVVSPRDPLRPLVVEEGPGREVGKTGWTIRASDPNPDALARVDHWMAWHMTLADLSLVLGCSRVKTTTPGAYATLDFTGQNGSSTPGGLGTTFGLTICATVAASEEPGREWFSLALTQGSLSSRVQCLFICREQNYGGWLLMPSTPTNLRAMGRQGVAPFDVRFCQPIADRVVLNHLQIPALVTLFPEWAPAGPELSPLYRLPDDVALCGGHLNPNYWLMPGDGSSWLTTTRGFAVQIEGAVP